MRFGLWLTAQHCASIAPYQAVRQHVEQVKLAAELGFDLALAGQHFLSQPYWMLQNIPLLARVSAVSGQMWLGTGISLLTLLNPLEMAESVATMDAITSGRFILGVGQGYRQVENEGFGVASQRGALFENKVRVVRDLLAGARVTATGPGFQLNGAELALVPKHPVPIWIAANNDAGVRRAARLGDAWLLNPHSSLDHLERLVELFHMERARCGLPPATDVPVIKEICVRPTDSEAIAVARPYLERKYAAYVSWGQEATMPAGDTLRQDWASLACAGRFIVGSPETCVAQVQEHVARLGMTTLVCRVQWPGTPQEEALRSIELFAREVMPIVREQAQVSTT